jgi:hypothetical protein
MFLVAFLTGSSQQDNFSLFLVGDAGENTVPGAALQMLKEELHSHPNSAVVFLGDNAYPNGIRQGDKDSEAHLDSQLKMLEGYTGQAYFIPGNHDWDGQKRDGRKVLANQEAYVTKYLASSSLKNKGAVFQPAGGLPGPASVMLKDGLRLIMIDTQWFLHLYKRNSVVSKKHTKEMFYKSLDSLLKYSQEHQEQVIIAAHHPLYSNGQHSRARQPMRFLVNWTPLQLFGLCGLDRLYSQDLCQPRYRRMSKKMLGVMDKYKGIIYASGHEHNTQLLRIGGNRYVVSGNGSKLSSLRKRQHCKAEAVFSEDKKTGFVKLEFAEKIKTVVYREGVSPLELDY